MAMSDLAWVRPPGMKCFATTPTGVAIARKHCGKLLLRDDPARLFDARYVQSVPAANLIRFLDFTNDSNRGVQVV